MGKPFSLLNFGLALEKLCMFIPSAQIYIGELNYSIFVVGGAISIFNQPGFSAPNEKQPAM
eukprot:Gb_09630 [translate_table: standard]